MKLDAARNLLARDPDAADALLAELKAQTQAALADIRRLVHELRSPALDQFGLASALVERASRCSQDDLRVEVDAPDRLPPLPAAVEVAAYRIVLEALTSVVRHARARTCTVRLSVNGVLRLDVTDDGVGVDPAAPSGVGLTSMRERAAELGGRCLVERVPTGGTRVLAELPLPSEAAVDRRLSRGCGASLDPSAAARRPSTRSRGSGPGRPGGGAARPPALDGRVRRGLGGCLALTLARCRYPGTVLPLAAGGRRRLRSRDVPLDVGEAVGRDRDRVDPGVDQETGELGVVARRLAAEADLAPAAVGRRDHLPDHRRDRLVPLVEQRRQLGRVAVDAEDELRQVVAPDREAVEPRRERLGQHHVRGGSSHMT